MRARVRLLGYTVAALVALLTAAGGRAADRKPNFVFVYSDDHRWDAMGVVQKDQGKAARFPWFQSPNLDRLAAGGVRFRNAFVTLSLCAPSRAAFLTGRYNHANGITNNSRPFPADAVTHATLLRAAGYKTAYVGKWHMGNQKGPRPGFDYSAGFVGQGRYNDCPFEIDGKPTPTKGWVDAVSTDFAIGWMKENRDKPFSLVLGLKSPHGPRGGNGLPEHLRKLYANETTRPTPNCGIPAVFHQKDPKTGQFPLGLADNAVHLDYLRHIAGVDEQVGRLLDALDELKLTDDTVVVYASDNGYFLGEHNSGDKRALYDESLRIPFLVRYPRLFGKGQTVDEMVLNIDLAPTFLDLAGVPIPKEMKGASWKELAAGRKPATWRTAFFAEYYKELGNVPTCYALRTKTHKLVKYPGRPEWTEVFDLTADPYEVKNLAPDAKLTAKLEGELSRLVKDVGYTEPKAADPPKKPAAVAEPAARPNIVWIVVDDMSANFSCYGERLIQTPHVDRLATEGTRFARAFVTAPVCSPCRSALITGCYQTTIGAHHHRSGRGELRIALPGGVVPAPVLFQRAGYYTCIGGFQATGDKLGKTDYNFEWDRAMYDGNDWAGRKPGQPFFMQVQLHGGKFRGQGPNKNWQNRVRKELGSNTRPEDVKLPPYYPRDPVILQDWADYLDCCRYTDKEVGDALARLEQEKLLDDTVVFFMTDHGISHARGKQFLYDEGTHVPFVVRGPGVARGTTRDDLIEHIDLTATSLALAGIEIPKWMQGRNVLARDYARRDAVFAARDRCDETMEHIRGVRTERFKYIRNYLHQRPHLQPCRYKDEKAVVRRLRELHAAGKLDALTEALLFAEARPAEELYDLAADPHEVTNLAADPKHKATLEAMRRQLADWEERTGDRGRRPEPMAMYDSDMKVYLGGAKKDNAELKRNIDLNKKWAAEGK